MNARTHQETTSTERSRTSGLMREVRWMALLVVALVLAQNFLAKPFFIPSVSMMPTLVVGDRLIVSKYPYGWSWASLTPRLLPRSDARVMGRLPDRGDIVTAAPPGWDGDYIKRVIGLPGDTVEVRGGRLVLNGRMVAARSAGTTDFPVDDNLTCREGRQSAYLKHTAQGYRCRLPIVHETLPGGVGYDTIDLGYQRELDDYGPIVVPEGHVFLMGDNRDQSADSRVSAERNGLGGPVPLSSIGGRAEFIPFSLTGRWPPFRMERTGIGLRAGRDAQPGAGS